MKNCIVIAQDALQQHFNTWLQTQRESVCWGTVDFMLAVAMGGLWPSNLTLAHVTHLSNVLWSAWRLAFQDGCMLWAVLFERVPAPQGRGVDNWHGDNLIYYVLLMHGTLWAFLSDCLGEKYLFIISQFVWSPGRSICCKAILFCSDFFYLSTPYLRS